MAGAGLIALKRRIKSITSTQKITKAMGLVATSKLRKSREMIGFNEKYYDSFNETVKDIAGRVEESSIYVNGNNSKKKLYIALTSDSGLCGGFNANVVNKVAEVMGGDKENSVIISVGQKGRVYFNRLKYQTTAEFVSIPDMPTIKEASAIAYKALNMFEKGEVGEVYVIYSKFFSAVKQVVTVDKVLPLQYEEETKQSEFIKIEPDVDAVLHDVVGSHFKQVVLNHMFHAKASEQASRMQAMDGATKNADDLISSLTLKFNRVRQSVITQEISEIVSGAEAQK